MVSMNTGDSQRSPKKRPYEPGNLFRKINKVLISRAHVEKIRRMVGTGLFSRSGGGEVCGQSSHQSLSFNGWERDT